MSQPLILIGAARSGTRLLRDLIAAHPAVDRVPYDVNFIWRLGNDSVPHDELGPELATAAVRANVRRHVLNFARGAPWLVEKTVSNTLRVEFVDAVFPDARYVHVLRDGRDVAESAYRQWTARPNWGDIVRKIPGFPMSMLFGYGRRYAAAALRRATGTGSASASAVPVWGPAYRGIQADLASRTLIEVCALQWQVSVLRAFDALDRLDQARVLVVRYEELVKDPAAELSRIWHWMGIGAASTAAMWADVTPANIGRGRSDLGTVTGARLDALIAHGMARSGYSTTGKTG